MFTLCDADGIGERIKAARIRRGLTQEALAEKAGIALSTVGMIERGKRSPSPHVLVAIMNQLRVEPNLIFCENPYTEESGRRSKVVKEVITLFDLYSKADPPDEDD